MKYPTAEIVAHDNAYMAALAYLDEKCISISGVDASPPFFYIVINPPKELMWNKVILPELERIAACEGCTLRVVVHKGSGEYGIDFKPH